MPRSLLFEHLANNCALKPATCVFAKLGCTAVLHAQNIERYVTFTQQARDLMLHDAHGDRSGRCEL